MFVSDRFLWGRGYLMLAKLTAKNLSKSDQLALIERAKNLILKKVVPQKIILFGSASRMEMTNFSDLDFVLVFATPKETLDSKKSGVFQISSELNWPVDLLLIDEVAFQSRALQGGVFQIINEEGNQIFERKFAK
jgi:predicted nucleotidyltransferase